MNVIKKIIFFVGILLFVSHTSLSFAEASNNKKLPVGSSKDSKLIEFYIKSKNMGILIDECNNTFPNMNLDKIYNKFLGEFSTVLKQGKDLYNKDFSNIPNAEHRKNYKEYERKAREQLLNMPKKEFENNCMKVGLHIMMDIKAP